MSVVGAHRNFVIGPARPPPSDFFVHHSADRTYHIRTARQMFRFIKRSVGLARYLPKMQKVNARAEFASHGQEIVIGSCPKRSDTKRQSVAQRIAGRENRAHILSG